jgi:hypothetical protein
LKIFQNILSLSISDCYDNALKPVLSGFMWNFEIFRGTHITPLVLLPGFQEGRDIKAS